MLQQIRKKMLHVHLFQWYINETKCYSCAVIYSHLVIIENEYSHMRLDADLTGTLESAKVSVPLACCVAGIGTSSSAL